MQRKSLKHQRPKRFLWVNRWTKNTNFNLNFLWFLQPWSWFVPNRHCLLRISLPTYDIYENSRTRFFLAVGSHPQTSKLRQSMQSSREIICGLCFWSVRLPEMKCVLKRIHRSISER
jgi:hypothetical protein